MSEPRTTNYEPVNVTIIGGAGYVGFITGLGLAELGHRVVGVDIAADKVEMLRSGRSPIYEEGVDLNEVLRRNLEAGRIQTLPRACATAKSSSSPSALRKAKGARRTSPK